MADSDKHTQPLVTVTQTLIDAAEKIILISKQPNSFLDECKKIKENQCKNVSLQLVRDIYRALRNEGQAVFLHELVDGAEFVLPTVIPPPRSPELEARIRKLKVEEENREYKKMTRNVAARGQKQFSFQDDVKSMNRQMVAMLNFALTVLAGFAFGFKGTEYVFGKIFPMQMMSGLIVGTVVFFVDLYFIMRYGV